jgi:thiamine pyrophosphate-dependent acetolactate synthase large subunit-like protein
MASRKLCVCVLCSQALWSQAREQAHVITIICANNTYNILKVGSQQL